MSRLQELLELDQSSELRKKSGLSMKDENDIEVFAFSIEQALQAGSEALNASIVSLEYEILERGTNGFLGFGKKPYRILVKKSTASSGKGIGIDPLDIDFDANNEIMMNQDGNFKILIKKQGVILKVNAPKGEGKYVQFGAIATKIAAKELPKFDEGTVKKEINNPSGKWIKIANYIPSQFDSTFQVEIAPDEMKAFVTIAAPEKFGRILEHKEIETGLKSKKVAYGIKDEVIENAIENELYNMPILVAEGEAPIEGKDSEIKYHFKTSTDEIKFDMAEDGSIDFHKLDIIQSVVVGQVLATKIPAEKGKTGETITGRILPSRDGRDMKLIPGTNTHVSADGSQVIADINGQVVFKNGKINVEPVLEIQGDIDLSTGDINFPGNVIIYGSVNDTFKVYSGGNIEIKESIGKAEVVAEGNIIVRQGIQGKDEAKVICSGDLYARFVERAILQVESDIIIQEVLLHSHVECKGSIFLTGGKRSQIAGGSIKALYEINAKHLGAEAYTDTVLEAGIDHEAEEKILEIMQRKSEIEKELVNMAKILNNLSMMMAKGPLPPEKESQFNKLTLKNAELREEKNAIIEQHDELHKRLEELGDGAKISASKITYPGVKIRIKSAVLLIKSEYKYVTFHKQEGLIKVVPYEKPKEIEEKVDTLKKRKKY